MKLTKRQTALVADRLFCKLAGDGGFTVQLGKQGNVPDVKQGYTVSDSKYSVQCKALMVRAVIRAFLEEGIGIIGGWHDYENLTYEIASPIIFDDLDKAMVSARNLGERYIYDLANGRELSVASYFVETSKVPLQ